MSPKTRRTQQVPVVELVYRIHADGRRERQLRLLVPGPEGGHVPGPARPTGALAEFAAQAVSEAVELGLAQQDRRRRPSGASRSTAAPFVGRERAGDASRPEMRSES